MSLYFTQKGTSRISFFFDPKKKKKELCLFAERKMGSSRNGLIGAWGRTLEIGDAPAPCM